MLAAGVQSIMLENIKQSGSEGGLSDVCFHGSRPSGNSSMQAKPYGDDGTCQVNFKAGSDPSYYEKM